MPRGVARVAGASDSFAARRALLVVLTAAALSCAAHADEVTRDRFAQDAPAAWAEYQAWAEYLHGTLDITQLDRRSGNRVISQRHHEIRLAGSRAVLVTRSDAAVGLVQGQNSQYAFQLERVQPAGSPGAWKISGFERYADRRPLGPKSAKEWALGHVCRGLRIFGTWLPEMVKDPGFTTTAASPERHGNEELVRVEFDYRPEETQNNPVRSGMVLLDPERSWVIRRAEVQARWESNEEGTITIDAEYDDHREGFPMIRRYVAHVQSRPVGAGAVAGGPPAVDHELIFEYQLRRVENSDDADFMLSSFGLPEPALPAESGVRWWWIVVIIGFVLVICAILMRSRAARA